MGTTLRIDGEAQEHREDKTVADLKQAAGMSPGDVVYFVKDGDKYTLTDQDRVGNIPDGAAIGSRPVNGNVFG